MEYIHAMMSANLIKVFMFAFYMLQYFQDGARIEAAFRKYFHRADPEQKADSVEIIICHANVIRYFVCRSVWRYCSLLLSP